MHTTLAWIGALLAVFSVAPYLYDIVKGRTKPNIVSWFTWTLLTSIVTAAALAAGEPRTALLSLASTICTASVVILGIKFGIAKFSRFDMICQVSAVVGLLLWLLFNSPAIAIIASVTIDFIALLPTLRHSWLQPYEETWQTFLIGTLAPLFTIASLTAYSIESLLFPFYIFLANGSITLCILYRRNLLQKHS